MMCKDAKKGKNDDLFLFYDENGNEQTSAFDFRILERTINVDVNLR